MIYLYSFLIIVLTLFLIVLKAWSLQEGAISDWGYYLAKKQLDKKDASLKNLAKLLSIKPHLLDLQFKLIIITYLLLGLLLTQFLNWYQLLLALVAISLVTGFLSRLKAASKYSKKLFRRYQKQLLALSNISYKLGLISLRPSRVSQPGLVSSEQYDFLIKQSTIFNQKTKKVLLAAADFDKIKLKELLTPIEQLEQVELKQTLTPVLIDKLYKASRPLVAVTAKEQVIGVALLEKLTRIDNSNPPSVEQSIETDLSQFEAADKAWPALKQLIEARESFALVTKDQQIIGVIELKQLLASLKIV